MMRKICCKRAVYGTSSVSSAFVTNTATYGGHCIRWDTSVKKNCVTHYERVFIVPESAKTLPHKKR